MKIIAHRGYSYKAPENTLAAIKKALEAGVYGVEVDINITADGIPVVIHDQTLSRVTERKNNQKVESLSLAQIKKIDVGGWFAKLFNKEKIPTLEKAIDLVLPKAYLYIDMKNHNEKSEYLLYQTIKLIEKKDVFNKVVIHSANDNLLEKAREMSKKVKLRKMIFFYHPFLPFFIDDSINFRKLEDYSFVDGFNFDYGLNKEVAQKLKKMNKKFSIGARPKVSGEKLKQLEKWGVEFLMRNDIKTFTKTQKNRIAIWQWLKSFL
jgi:glycerophosphoryl diester phosphodiesterase